MKKEEKKDDDDLTERLVPRGVSYEDLSSSHTYYINVISKRLKNNLSYTILVGILLYYEKELES